MIHIIKMFSRFSSGAQTKVRIHPATGYNRFQLPIQHLSSTCPFDVNEDSPKEHPPLVHIPSLPFLGSTLSWYSNAPKIRTGNDYNFWLELRKRFGDFYTIGLPGFGNGVHGTAHIVTDAKEMAKVIRSEGKYPSGVIQQQWALKKIMKEGDHVLTRGGQDGFFGRSTDWKRLRTFLQTDLLSPKAASGYIPGVIHAAELASKGALASNEDLNTYLNHCSFDMFCTIMFGILSETADPNTPTDPENLEFCNAAKTQISTNNELNRNAKEVFWGKALRFHTDMYNTVKDAFATTERIGSQKIRQFIEKKMDGRLSSFEEKSWLSHAIDREAVTDDISEEEMRKLAGIALTAAVDTTSGLLSWNLLQVAIHPHVQENLYNELSTAVAETDGRLTPEILQNRSKSPYLHAIIRESHRVTPTAPLNVFKKVATEIEVHGQIFPEGTFFVFESYTNGMDPSIVDYPQSFRPERWLPDAVAARKGTPKSIIDNSFFKEPFSQG